MEQVRYCFEDVEVLVTPTQDTKQWFMTVEKVAEAYGVDRTTIVKHLTNHADELRDEIEKGVTNIHTRSENGVEQQRSVRILYRDGVIKLGFFIRSPRAASFRQFATNLIMEYSDNHSIPLDVMLSRMNNLETTMCNGFETVHAICRGLRDDVEELRSALELFISDDDATTIKALIRRIKTERSMDGRAIVGHCRQTLNVNSIYGTPDTKKVINVLRNLLGEGVKLVPNPTEVK